MHLPACQLGTYQLLLPEHWQQDRATAIGCCLAWFGWFGAMPLLRDWPVPVTCLTRLVSPGMAGDCLGGAGSQCADPAQTTWVQGQLMSFVPHPMQSSRPLMASLRCTLFWTPAVQLQSPCKPTATCGMSCCWSALSCTSNQRRDCLGGAGSECADPAQTTWVQEQLTSFVPHPMQSSRPLMASLHCTLFWTAPSVQVQSSCKPTATCGMSCCWSAWSCTSNLQSQCSFIEPQRNT